MNIKLPKFSSLLTLGVVLFIGLTIWYYGEAFSLTTGREKYTALAVWLLLALLITFLSLYLKERKQNRIYQKIRSVGHPLDKATAITRSNHPMAPIIASLRAHYGFFWRHKVTIYLLMGTPSAVEKLAPKLTHESWQTCDGMLLIYAGDIALETHTELIYSLKKLRRRRPINSIIWVAENHATQHPFASTLTLHHLNPAIADTISHFLHRLFKQLKWQAPIWLWNVTNNAEFEAENSPAVLCLTTLEAANNLAPALLELLPTLNTQGTHALLQDPKQAYLLILAQFLTAGGNTQLTTLLAPLYSGLRPLPFAGLVFSPATVHNPQAPVQHTWQPDVKWLSWRKAQYALPSRLKPAPRVIIGKRLIPYLTAIVMVLWASGMAVSYFGNQQLIDKSTYQVKLTNEPTLTQTEQFNARYQLQQTLGLLRYREQTYVPLWLQFGLSQNKALLSQLWPAYQHTVLMPLRDVVTQKLTQQLQQFVQLVPDSPKRSETSNQAYQALKSYLMLSDIDRMEATFFTDTVLTTLPPPVGMKSGEWQTLGRELLLFYAEQLPHHPNWAIAPDSLLVNRSRALLLQQITQRSGELALYQTILQYAKPHYADLTLNQLVATTDATLLFHTDAIIPGIFSRKAWEETIEPAIKQAVVQRRDAIDWVLSDNQQAIDHKISPEQLQQQLTERYFADFAASWLYFVNSLQWRQTTNLADTLDQLTLMSDVRQSPVIALMNTLAYQGKTARQPVTLPDATVKSANTFTNPELSPNISQKAVFTGPLEAIFTPIFNFIDTQTVNQANDNLSLSAYLARITRMRLTLQQIINAADSQAMSQTLAQPIFEGKAVNLTEMRVFGELVAVNLGQEWRGFGETLLVKPLTQAWQQLLTPAAQAINREWQSTLLNEWNTAFGGRYPFNNTQSEISLPLLAQYLKPDTGRIQRFLATRLHGVLHKEGHRWIPNTADTQGLRFNPAFLAALETLSSLSDVVFAQGEARLFFELRPKTSKNVMQTTLIVDKQPQVYDNQRPDWQRFVWPADTIASGASLSWMTTRTGTRLYAEHRGVWGIIRLLEAATVSPYAGNTSSYTLSWSTPDGDTLLYDLRTEMGEGPLALLKLRNFVLPEKIFLD